jgi:hypothetical protein
MTPVTIGDQKFIKDFNKGWIDSKTKQPADKGLIRLLDSLVINEPVLKKLRVKIDTTVEPVLINGQKFVYDVNQGWIDQKTKTPVPPSFQITLNNAVGKPTVPNVSASMGMAGIAGMQQTKTTVTPQVQKTGGGTLVYSNVNINKPIVKMIGALASIDGFLKQRLDNQKNIAKNNLLSIREAQIENISQDAQTQSVKPDAERISGSSAGLLGLGALALLTLDPVQEAIKSVVNGVVETGKFITGVVSTINKAFTFLLGSSAVDPTATESQSENGAKTPTPDAQPVTTEQKPSFFASVGAGAATGAVVGSIVPRVGMVAGAVVGGGITAYKHFTSSGSTTSNSSSTSSSAPQATPAPNATPQTTSTPAPNATPQTQSTASAPGQIPKNDIVALGNYLASMGADKSKMEHPTLSGRVGDHSQNSRHYRGMAIDVNFPGPNEGAILDALEPQLRAAGYNTIWRAKGHETHMHVSVGGREGRGSSTTGDANSLMSVASDTVNMGMEKIGELFGILGSTIIKPGVPRGKVDYSEAIGAAAVQTNAEIAVSKTPKALPKISIPRAPNINRSNTGTTQNPATSTDKNSVYYYLRRFGYQDLNVGESPLVKATVA